MKKSLFLFLLFPLILSAQGVEFIKSHGYNAIDIIYDNDPLHPRMSKMSYSRDFISNPPGSNSLAVHF